MRLSSKTLALAALLVVVALLGAVGLAAAAEAEKPKFKVFHAIVGAEEAKAISDGKVAGYLIDSRPAAKKFNEGHIPGAINIPFSQWDKMTDKLPQDKNALIIFYCEGPT